MSIAIDVETGDRIALCVLQDHYKYLTEEVQRHLQEGQYLHPVDLAHSQNKLIPALELLISYFGGELPVDQ